MKKLTLSFFLFLFCLFVSAQDEYKRIELKEGQKDPLELEFDYFKLYIYANSGRNGSEIGIIMDVENNDIKHDIFLFGHSYEEKFLKKQKPSIRFHKNCGGIKNIIPCEGCRGDEILRIEPGRKRNLSFENANHTKLELPLYIANHKLKKFLSSEKYIILQRSIITLDVEVIPENRIDETFEKLNTGYEDLLEELSEKTFCPRSTHQPSWEKQIEPYEKKKKQILDEITDIKRKNKWRDSSDEYQSYKELNEKVEKIDFDEYKKWCGKCGGPEPKPQPHHCSYCGWSLNSLLKSIERIYIKLDTGTPKSSVMGEVNAMYNAWTRGCPYLSKKKRGDTSGKSRQIDNYYNRIANFKE